MSLWEDVYPRAKLSAGSSQSRMVNKDAWGKAISDINSQSTTARAHPTDVLMKGLVEWKVFGISSSGVEQHFSKVVVFFGPTCHITIINNHRIIVIQSVSGCAFVSILAITILISDCLPSMVGLCTNLGASNSIF